MPANAPPMMAVPVMVQRRYSGMAIAGFVVSFFCGLLGLIFSIMGHNECKNSGGTVEGGGLAVAGIVISCITGILQIIYIIAIIAAVGGHHHYSY
jgi:hypothetical protein